MCPLTQKWLSNVNLIFDSYSIYADVKKTKINVSLVAAGISVVCITICFICTIHVAKKCRERQTNSCNTNDVSLSFENRLRGKFTLFKVDCLPVPFFFFPLHIATLYIKSATCVTFTWKYSEPVYSRHAL